LDIAIVDFETTGLRSDKGMMLCAGIKPLKGKPIMLGIKDFPMPARGSRKVDKNLVVKVRDELEKYDIWITWNGKMFDIPFLQDRLILNNQRLMEKRMHIDVMYFARQGQSRFQSSKLDWVATELGVQDSKTKLDMGVWQEAYAEVLSRFSIGHENYDYIVDHCEKDLLVTEQVFERLKRRIKNIHV
jgi:uncharacterized protein YprB with RNaseH-like and TPR domain